MRIKTLQLHKRDSLAYKFIQDKYAVDLLNKSFALSDGTTQSFKSEIWAALITTSFVKKPTFDINQLILNFKNCVEDFKSVPFELSSNPAKASLEKVKLLKGGTATFIGVQFLKNNILEVISIGDSNLFVLDERRQLNSFPFNNIEMLDNNNYFLNTEQLLKSKINESFFYKKTLKVQTGDQVILATDALSRLILQKPELIHEFILLSDFDSLHKFCLKYWNKKELQEDDISAIIIDFQNTDSLENVQPSSDFTFPVAKQEDFVPNSNTINTSTKFTNMQMQEIRNQFNGVASDFFEIKKKMQLLIVLLISIVSLILICLLFIFWFTPKQSNQEIKTNRKTDNTTIQKLTKKNKSLESEIKYLNKELKNKTLLIKQPSKSEKKEKEKKIGKISNEVAKERQRELKSAGYDKIIVDGKWGVNSEKSWLEFQKSKNN
ncbi:MULTISPECIES: hypothetical protein [unclassified Polaribacter]|uniref:hypothetical protein n=1 Tax=unclassified Polaribacter TaxID=196858 RepID=UPI0011BE3499|nr:MULTISPECIES: hypothetical protein [unclassified Polaribacter]TXD51684.1 hypothetical protein ES043_10735 [Polaribacter sp. IC063]TXD59565.1 hypothetical protein ES044_09845 [Polaribacter sp. IC066]